MSGWNANTIDNERGPWTDITGELPLAPIATHELNQGYVWKRGSDWELVLDWSDPAPDKDGWVYYNNFWQEAATIPRFDCFTRRRMWRRLMVETLENRP